MANIHDSLLTIYGEKHFDTPGQKIVWDLRCAEVVPLEQLASTAEKKHVDQMSGGAFVALLMVRCCVEPLCLSITLEPIFKGFTVAVSSEAGVCPGVRVCVASNQ